MWTPRIRNVEMCAQNAYFRVDIPMEDGLQQQYYTVDSNGKIKRVIPTMTISGRYNILYLMPYDVHTDMPDIVYVQSVDESV